MKTNIGTSPEKMRASNVCQVLRACAGPQCIGRAEISRILELTKTTVSDIVNELLDNGILCQGEVTVGPSCGRRPLGLLISPGSPAVFGVMLRRGELICVMGSLSGQIRAMDAQPLPPGFSLQQLERMLQAAWNKLLPLAGGRVFAVSCACAGPVNNELGTVLSPKNLYEPSQDYAICSFLQRITGKPTFLCNDSAAGAAAEQLYADVTQDFVYVSLTEGVGTGLILGGKLYEGTQGFAGELGHVCVQAAGEPCPCGSRGCLEMYANMRRIREHAREYVEVYPGHAVFDEKTDLFELIALLNSKDSFARLLLDQYVFYLACALRSMLNCLGLTQVRLGCPDDGAFSSLLAQKLNAGMGYSHKQIAVLPSAFGAKGPVYGTMACVLDKMLENERLLKIYLGGN